MVFCFDSEQISVAERHEHGTRIKGVAAAQSSWILANEYLMLRIAMGIGSFIFMAILQTITLMQPGLPTLIQAFFFCFWLVNINLRIITDFSVVFLLMMASGGLQGTVYTNFLYLANAKVALPCDMNLIYYERELTVVLLLAVSDLGHTLALALSLALKWQCNSELVY